MLSNTVRWMSLKRARLSKLASPISNQPCSLALSNTRQSPSSLDSDNYSEDISKQAFKNPEDGVPDLELYDKYHCKELQNSMLANQDIKVSPTEEVKAVDMQFDFDFETRSELSIEFFPDFEVLFTPLEPTPQISKVLSVKRLFLAKIKNVLHAPPKFEFTYSIDSIDGENYAPVSMRIPVLEQESYEERSRFFRNNWEHSQTLDPRIKFSEYADVLVYNGNYETNMAQTNNQNSNFLKSGAMHKIPYSERETGLCSESQPGDKLGFSLAMNKGSILKKKTNVNYEIETSHIKSIDHEDSRSTIYSSLGGHSVGKKCLNEYADGISRLRNYYQSIF